MTSSPQKPLGLVFLGTPEYAAISLRRLLATPHRVLAVVTRPDKPRGRGKTIEPSPVKREALGAGIEVLEPASPRDPHFLEHLRALDADLGVVVAYGRILPLAALEAPRFGCINAHASLLPKLRGAAPIERAILAGLRETGVTIMQMNEGLDEGDILLARSTPIDESTDGGALRERLADMSADLLIEALELIAEQRAPLGGRAQDGSEATFAPPLRREEFELDWSADARAAWLRVRAFAPRPGAFTMDGALRLKVLEARVAETAQAAAPGTLLGASAVGILVACGSGALEILEVQPEGKRAMRALDYERGMRRAAGRVLGRAGAAGQGGNAG